MNGRAEGRARSHFHSRMGSHWIGLWVDHQVRNSLPFPSRRAAVHGARATRRCEAVGQNLMQARCTLMDSLDGLKEIIQAAGFSD